MINNKNKKGFTILEALLALIISCIVMAASVPILTMKKDQGLVETWRFSRNNSDVYYGASKNHLNVGIGTTAPRARLHVLGYANDNTNPVMTIQTRNESASIKFLNANGTEIGKIFFEPQRGSSGNNISIGANAMPRASISSSIQKSVAIGTNAQQNNTNAWGNVAIGTDAMRDNSSSDLNVAIGFNAAQTCTSTYSGYIIGDHHMGTICSNMGSGTLSNIFIGDEAGGAVANGYQGNIYLGFFAGNNTFGNNNIIIGTGYSLGGASNTLIIGDYIRVTNLGGSPDMNMQAYNDVHIYANTVTSLVTNPSDIRLKNIIGKYDKSIDDVMKIDPIQYKLKSDGPGGRIMAGVSAQKLRAIMPQSTTQDKKGYYFVDYKYVDMAMLNSLKDLKKQNDEMKARVAALKQYVEKERQNKCKCQ